MDDSDYEEKIFQWKMFRFSLPEENLFKNIIYNLVQSVNFGEGLLPKLWLGVKGLPTDIEDIFIKDFFPRKYFFKILDFLVLQ